MLARRTGSAALAILVLSIPSLAHASFLPPEVAAAAATYVAWFVVIVMPIAGIVLFWLVHILPEKVAEKRHHPQAAAIQTLCLLSLLFGGLLWPLAWLWAYTKPTAYRSAYGTDKSDEYFVKMAERATAGEVDADEIGYLCDELDGIAARGALSPELRGARAKLAAALPPPAAPSAAPAAAEASVTGAA